MPRLHGLPYNIYRNLYNGQQIKKLPFKWTIILCYSLEWSPVHKSAKFWRENAVRLNERGQELLRTLVHLLEKSNDPVVLAVACYDVGEYVRHYPRGKQYVHFFIVYDNDFFMLN